MDERAPAPSSRCPTCYAARAIEQLDAHRERGGASFERAGTATANLDHLADAARGWRFCAEHAPAGELTALDRADMRRELEIRAEQCEDSAIRAEMNALGEIGPSASWRARALRIRQLIALLAVLLVCACNEWPLGAPPYAVCFDASVPADDRAVWREAEARWNVEIGTAVLLDETAGCDVRVRASSELAEPACTLPVDDHVRIFYVPALLRPCVALHELAHVLLGPGRHVPGTVLDEYGCDYPDVTAPVAELVCDEWGL